MQTTTIGGYNIPKDAVIMPNLDSVQMSEHIWEDPKAFRPSRFLAIDGNLGKVKDEFIPFSVGEFAEGLTIYQLTHMSAIKNCYC